MKRWAIILATTVTLAIVFHVVTVIVIPYGIMAIARKQMQNKYNVKINTLYHLPPSNSDSKYGAFGINLLSKNIDVRPNEIRTILELEISPKSGLIAIPGERTKDGKSKYIYLDDEDIEFLGSIPKGMPHLQFLGM